MKKNIKILLLTTLAMGGMSFGKQTYAWDSNKNINVMDSHKTISVQALKLIRNDMKSDTTIMKNLDILEQNLNLFKKGAVAPDFGVTGVDKDYDQYQDHFFNPYTGKNFTYESWWYLPEKINDTAESQTRNYVAQAVAKWKDGNYADASYLLGKATHYFADLNEPHHASNLTAVDPTSSHSKFEKYVGQVQNNFLLNTIGEDKSEYTTYTHNNLSEFLSYQSYKYAKLAYALAPKAVSSSSWKDWNEAAEQSFKNAQRSTATVIYRFLKEVTHDGQSIKNPIGKFHVVIKTSNETNAGTDDYVYFGMELKNGMKKEFYCNLPGNDFAKGTVGSYEFEITDVNFDPAQIKNVWLRKAAFNARDDWKPETLDIYIQGTRVLTKTINQWLGNGTYNIPVNGLK